MGQHLAATAGVENEIDASSGDRAQLLADITVADLDDVRRAQFLRQRETFVMDIDGNDRAGGCDLRRHDSSEAHRAGAEHGDRLAGRDLEAVEDSASASL